MVKSIQPGIGGSPAIHHKLAGGDFVTQTVISGQIISPVNRNRGNGRLTGNNDAPGAISTCVPHDEPVTVDAAEGKIGGWYGRCLSEASISGQHKHHD